MRACVLVWLVAFTAVSPGAATAQHLAVVTGVVDGDTIHVGIGNQMETVRYIGVNTPELHHPTKGRQPGGDVAREINRQLVAARWVRLYFDARQRDDYGRLLAYVYTESRFINAELVWRGYAEAATHAPNVYFAAHFRDLARQARAAKRGLWADDVTAAALLEPRVAHADTPHVRREPGGGISIPVPAQIDNAFFRTTAGREKPVHVRAYERRDGTFVREHFRSAPTRDFQR